MSEWTDSRPGSTGRSQGSAECLTPPPQVLPMPQQQQQQGYSAGYGVPPQYQPPQYQQVQQQQQQPQAGYAPQPQPQEYRRPQQHFSPNTAPHGNRQAEQMADPQETRTLLVVLRELSDSIELDQIYSIFSQFGVVEKLSAFLQHGKNQVVVQFNNSQAAHLAMGYLNGRELKLQGVKGPVTCTLAILPSRLKELTFKRDDNRNRDFAQTNANLERLVQAVRSGMPEGELAQLTQQMHLPTLYDFVWGNWVFGEGWLYPVQAEDARGRIPEIRQLPEGKLGDCVHISGLPTGSGPARRLNAVELWNVVGMYGELVAVKMLAQHPGCALLQFGSSEHANNCIKNMNYARLYGSKIFAQTSRNSNATHWRGAHTELEARMCTTQDKVAPAPAPVHLTGPPGLTIAAWGLPSDDNLALQVMTDLCMPHGAVYIASRGQGMATAQFLNTEAAFEAVSHLNNTNGVLNGFSYTVCLHFPTEEVTSYPVIASTGVASTPPCPSYSPANPPSTASTPPYLALGPQPVQQTPPGVAIAPHMSQQQQPQHQPQPQQQHQPPPAMAGRKMARNAWRVPPTASPAVHNAQPPMGQDGGMYGRGSQHTHAPYAPSSDAAWGASRTA